MTKSPIEAMRHANIRHGHSVGRVQSKEYRSYRAMLARCQNPKHQDFKYYGGRGIGIAKEWLGKGGFERFLASMGLAPSPQHTVDRIDANQGYSPLNCRWATPTEQVRNRRNTIFYNGKPMMEWANHFGLSYRTLMDRFWRGDRGDHLFRRVTVVRRHPA